MERIKLSSDNRPQYMINRLTFAAELRHLGIDVDLDDWGGLDDDQVTRLVLAHNIERSQVVFMIKRDCEEPKEVRDAV